MIEPNEISAATGEQGGSRLKKAKLVHQDVGYRGLHLNSVDAMWKTEEGPVYSLANDNLFFVNRDLAVQQLQEIHQQKYNRVVNNAGLDWQIPIADNVVGLGKKKSSFGDHYIRKWRDTWKGEENKSGFQKACRTDHITFKKGELLENADTVMIAHLRWVHLDMFDKPPAILSHPPQTVCHFLKS